MTAKPTAFKSSELRTQMGCLMIDGKKYPVYEGVNTVGRNKDATIILRDPSVSQQHALIIIINENQHFVSDLHSFNGTIVECNKLNPLLLYELPLETVIHFANCKAKYEKVSSHSQSNDNHNGCNIETTGETQSLTDSFYAAQTQALHGQSPTKADLQGPTCNYFEDDYNFADIPSPPMDQTNLENKTVSADALDKSGLSIHELPTQLYCSLVVNDVVIGESQTPASSKINMGYEVITTKVDVHELPTQIIDHEETANESVGKTQSEAPSLHDMPTQIIDKISVSKENSLPYDLRNVNPGDTVGDKSTQSTNKNFACKSSSNDAFDDIVQCKNNSNDKKKSVSEVSLDVIDETHLDDSGLCIAEQSVESNKSGRGSVSVRLEEEEAIVSLGSDPQSPLHVSQLHRRTLKPIIDDTEDDISSSGSANIKSKLRKKSKRLLESVDSNSEEIGKVKKKCHVIDSDNSETDIEDMCESLTVNVDKVPKTKNEQTLDKTNEKISSRRRGSSNSDTDIEDFGIHDEVSKTFENNVKIISATTVSKPNINNFEIIKLNETEVSSNNSDSDNDFEFDVKNKIIKEKAVENLNNSSLLNETDVIPNTPVCKGDDDDDNFSFMPEGNSTLVAKDSSNQTKEHIFDVSQKLKELRKASIIPQNCSEESFHLSLSEATEGNESAKHSEEQEGDNKNEDDDKTPDISDIDEPLTESDDIFNKSTQKVIEAKKVDDDIFAMATQKLADDIVVQNEKDDEIFAKPTTSKCFSNIKKQSESRETEDDLFMQPTQPVVADNLHSKDLSSAATDNEDIFMQPTQIYEVNNQDVQPICTGDIEDDIFMQPTQRVVSSDALVNHPLPVSQRKSPVVTVNNQPVEDIFMQPTQVFATESTLAAKQLPNESIFLESTQRIEVSEPKADNSKLDNDDLFMQPTQQIVICDVPSNEQPCNSDKVIQPPLKHSLSLHKDSVKRNRIDDVESQLEVMFASQTLRISSQTNLRPSNPLVNVLDGKPIANSESNSEEVEVQADDSSKNEDAKSSKSDNSLDSSDDAKEYCAMPTLPIDELADFQTSSHQAEQKSGNKPTTRGRPKTTTTILPQETSASGTPRKRGRPAISEIKKRKARKISDDEKSVVKVTTSEQVLEKTVKTRNRHLLMQEPCPSTSTTGIAKHIEGNKKGDEKRNIFTDKGDETNLKQKYTSSRITRKNKADEESAKNSKDTNRKKKKPDDDSGNAENKSKSTVSTSEVENPSISNIQNSESDEDDNQEIIKHRTRTQSKTNIKKPLNANEKRLRKNNISEITQENSESEGKPENVHNNTNKRSTRNNKQDKPSTTSNEVEEVVAKESRTLRRKKVEESVPTILISSSSSDSNSEKVNITPPSTVKRRKVNDQMQIKEENAESKIVQGKAASATLNRKDSNIVNTTVKSKKQLPAKRHMQTRGKTTNLETPDEEHTSTNLTPSTSDVSCSSVGGNRSKRLLNKDSGIDKTTPVLKKNKNIESTEKEEIESNSDTSEINFRTPRRNNLNVTLNTPDRNRRVQKPKVVFTMLNSPELESLVRRLGGMVVDTVSACTVLVTGSLKRSQKLLSAVGEGKPICSPKWLNECKRANKFLDPLDYILEDEEAEGKWNFSLKESLNRSRSKKLLQEFTIVLTVSEAVDVLKAAIESCGGKCVMRVPPKNVENNLVIVANPNKKATYSKFLKHQPPAIVVAPEAIFDGVLRQELHWEDHILS